MVLFGSSLNICFAAKSWWFPSNTKAPSVVASAAVISWSSFSPGNVTCGKAVGIQPTCRILTKISCTAAGLVCRQCSVNLMLARGISHRPASKPFSMDATCCCAGGEPAPTLFCDAPLPQLVIVVSICLCTHLPGSLLCGWDWCRGEIIQKSTACTPPRKKETH